MSAVEEKSVAAAVVKRAPMPMNERGFNLDFENAWRFAKGLIEGGMVPKGITQPGAVVGLIEAGKELGLAPMYALANLTFTNGRLGIMGDAAKALIRRAGALEPGTDFVDTYSGEEGTAEWTCTITAHRKGMKEPFSRSFSIANGIAAKLIRLEGKKVQSRKGDNWIDYGPWSTYTKRMLMYRALGFLARDYFSDVLGGAVLTEELRDYSIEEVRASQLAPPAEPDPLLTGAHTVELKPEATEAEIVIAKCDGNHAVPACGDVECWQTARPADDEPSKDAAATIKAVEKLEGDIVTAESLDALTKVWGNAAPVLLQVSASERARLERLLAQNASNFGKPQPSNEKRATSRR